MFEVDEKKMQKKFLHFWRAAVYLIEGLFDIKCYYFLKVVGVDQKNLKKI